MNESQVNDYIVLKLEETNYIYYLNIQGYFKFPPWKSPQS